MSAKNVLFPQTGLLGAGTVSSTTSLQLSLDDGVVVFAVLSAQNYLGRLHGFLLVSC